MLAPTPAGAPSDLYAMIHEPPQRISIKDGVPAMIVYSTRHSSLYRMLLPVMPTR
jgi:hypothetical protein